MSYAPSDQSQPRIPWNITLLSQRDVSAQIPVNYINSAPGVSIAAACFADHVYKSNATAQCLSNLLATGFRRLSIDLYWDTRRLTWSFCPVELPAPATPVESKAPSGAPSTLQTEVSGGQSVTQLSIASNESTSRPPPTPTVSGFSTAALGSRQTPGSIDTQIPDTITGASAFLTTFALDQTATSTATAFAITSSPTSNRDEVLYLVGSYVCSASLDLPFLIGFLDDFLKRTENTLQAVITYIVFSIRVAKPLEKPQGPAVRPDPARLPSSADLIGVSLNANLSSYLFTPTLLSSERSDLNSSWLTAPNSSQPDPSYYTSQIGRGDTISSPNGWPSESFMVFENNWRLILGTDFIDPQLGEYDFEQDQNYLFPPGFLSNYSETTQAPGGSGPEACPFDPNKSSPATANSSWAVETQPLDGGRLETNSSQGLANLYKIANLTACGTSQVLNNTLGGTTADESIEPYQEFVFASAWNWAYGEPRGDSQAPAESESENDGPSSDFRCAVLNGNGANEGRWSVGFCHDRHLGGCRTNGLPYSWQLTTQEDIYGDVSEHCPNNASFAVPRTALESRYLLEVLHNTNTTAVWIDFNSVDAEYCWVSGANSTCPYKAQPSHGDNDIIVPTVAAIIIIVLALLTVLIKCGSNRIKSKKRRRVLDGWDYEGVPS